MDRKERLLWIKIAQEINNINDTELVYQCPCDKKLNIKYEKKEFSLYNKKELHLICEGCNIHLVFTSDIIS